MIVELAHTVRFQGENIDGRTHQRTVFPAPAVKGEYDQSRYEKVAPGGN